MSNRDDPCYWGHEAGCEHMVDMTERKYGPEGRCDVRRCWGNGKVTRCVFGMGHLTECDFPRPEESSEPVDARSSQVGGDHYRKYKIQPWDIWAEYQLDSFTGAVIKYLLRDKGKRLEDLRKARHTLDRLIEIEEKRDGVLREEAEEAR